MCGFNERNRKNAKGNGKRDMNDVFKWELRWGNERKWGVGFGVLGDPKFNKMNILLLYHSSIIPCVEATQIHNGQRYKAPKHHAKIIPNI